MQEGHRPQDPPPRCLGCWPSCIAQLSVLKSRDRFPRVKESLHTPAAVTQAFSWARGVILRRDLDMQHCLCQSPEGSLIIHLWAGHSALQAPSLVVDIVQK